MKKDVLIYGVTPGATYDVYLGVKDDPSYPDAVSQPVRVTVPAS